MKTKSKIKNPFFLILKLVLGVLLLLVIFLTTYGLPIRINTSAIEINISSPDYFGYYVERRVEIRGRYIIRLFGREHEFIGHIRISGYPETYNEMESLQLYVRPFDANNFRVSPMQYYECTRQHFASQFGMIYTRNFFFEPWIISIGGGIASSPIVIPSVSSFEEGFEVALWFLTFADE